MSYRVVFCIALVGILSLIAGGTTLADDLEWKGGTSGDTTGWASATNWCSNGQPGPPGSDDHAIIDLESETTCLHPLSTCVVNTASAVTVSELTLQGNSPTKMKLHIRDKELDVTGTITYADYGEILAEKDFNVADNDLVGHMSGNVWIHVNNGITAYLARDLNIVGSALTSSYISCWLGVDDFTDGECEADRIHILANAGDAHRGLQIIATGSTLFVNKQLQLTGDDDASPHRAKLWLASGTLVVENFAGAEKGLDLNGGTTQDGRVEVDVDGTLIAESTEISGNAEIDIAATKTVYGGDVVFIGGTGTKKITGGGTFKSGSPPP